MQVPNIPKLRVPGLYTPGLRALEVPLPVMGNREFSMPRVFTDPVLNMRVRQYYENETNNILTQLGGRVAGAGVGAGTGALLGSTIAAIGAFIATLITPIPGDEAAGGAALAGALSAASAASKTGAAVGAGIGAGVGFVASDYTTYHAMNDLIKNTMVMIKENPGQGALNALYTVGKSMDIMSGGEAIRASIYSLVNGENALENIAKAYGLTYEGRREFDTETIRKSLGVDLGRVGNFVIDLFGDLVTDPGFIGAVGAMKLSSKAGSNVFTEALEQATKEADAINSLFSEAVDNPRMKKHLYKALLEKDYSTIITEVAKRQGSTELTATAVRKFVDTVNDASRKYVSNNLYNLFKNVDNVDDIVTGYLFKTALPPLGGLSLAKKGYKLVRKYVGITDGTSLGKLNYLVFGNAAKYNFEDYLDQDLEKMYNSEVAKWVRMQYGETTPDTSKVIMKIDNTDYTVNQLYRDVDKLKELQEKEVLLKDEDILLKQQIEARLATAKDFLNDELNKLAKEINDLDPTKVVDTTIVDDNFEGILDLYRNYSYNKWVLDILNDHGNVTFLRRIMRNIQRMYAFTVTNKTTQVVVDGKNKTKKVFKSLEDVGLRKQFDSQVDELIKLINDHPELLDTLSAGYYARFIKYISDNIDDGIKKSITDLFKASSESFEQGRKALDEKYDILKNKSEKIIDKINNVDTAYHKYEKRTKLETPKTKEEYLQSKIASLEKLNKSIDKMNKELNVLKQNTRFNVNYFLYRHLVDSKFVSDISGKFNPFKAADGKKEYVKLLDSFHNVISRLNNLDIYDKSTQKIIDQIIIPYTNYLLDAPMDKEVAAVFRTDTNIHKIFNSKFNYDALYADDFDIDNSLDMMGLLRVITDNKKLYIQDQLKIHEGTNKVESFVNWDKAISGFQKTLETRSVDFWKNSIVIGMGNKDIAEKVYTIMLNRAQYNTTSFISYAKELMTSKTNPALIVYIDYYIDTFKNHISRLDRIKSGSIINRDKLKELVALLEANRTVLFNKGYNDDLFNVLKNEIRTLDNYFTTDNMIRNIEDFSKSQIDLKKKILENKRQEYVDKTNKEKSAVKFKKYLGLKADPFVERYTSQIAELDKQIDELNKDMSILNNNVFELKLQLDKVMRDSPTMFISKNADDYAFDFAVDSLIINSRKFVEDNGYRFSKNVSANTLGVLHQMAPFDLFARRLLNYIEPVLKNLDYSDLDKVRESLELINTMASHMQLFRESHKAMDELGILSTFHIDKDKLIVKLKDGTDITDYFQAPVYKYSPVKIEVDRNGDKLDVPYISHQWTTKMQPNYSFDSFRFKQYLLDNKIDLEVNKIDLNKFTAVNDIFNSKYLLPVEDIFQTTINGRDIIYSPKNSVVFNRKTTAKNPTRFIYIDIEASNSDEHIGEALIQQLHMIEVDIDGNVINEQSFFIDPEEFEELTTKGRFTKSEDAIAVNGIDSIRLQQEFKNKRTRTLAQMKDEFEKFGCGADDAVVIAHNGGGYDFGVLINNFYNNANEKIFDDNGKLIEGKSKSLDINCIDSLQMSMALFNRGQRMINVELAKAHGLDVKIIKGAPDASNVKDTDELVEYIYDGKAEYYFKGKPLHDAEADTRLTSVWNISQIQELQKIMPSDVNFYDFVSDPTSFNSQLRNKLVEIDEDDFEQIYIKYIGKALYDTFYANPLYYGLDPKTIEGSRKFVGNYSEVTGSATDVDHIGADNPEYFQFKKLLGEIFSYNLNILDRNTSYSKILGNVTYEQLCSVMVDLEDDCYIDELFSKLINKDVDAENVYRSTIDHESEVYKTFRKGIDNLYLTLDKYYNNLLHQQNQILDFAFKHTNIGFQQINQVYVRTILNNMVLTDSDFSMFRNILSGNSNAFTKGDNYWILAEAIKNTDSEQLAIARQYFNDLYDSAMWYNNTIQRYGTNNIDTVHQLMSSATTAMKDFDDVDDFREYLNEVLTDKLGRMKSVENSPVTLGEAEVQEIIERVCSKFDQPEYPLIISGDLTNKMYKYIKEEIMDKIATTENLNKIYHDNIGAVNELYDKFNASFQNMLGSFRSVLADVKKENRLHRLDPIDLNNFSQANGVRPYDLPLYNSKYTIKYSYAKRQDSKVSQAMQPIFEGCYKNTNNPSKMVLNFGNTSRGSTMKRIADLLEMDTLEMLNLSKFVKNLDNNAAYDMMWEDMLQDTADPDYLKFAEVQVMLNAITEDNASYIADLDLYKKRIRNVFLSNYLEKEKLFNNFEIDNTKSFTKWKRKNKKFYDTIKDTFNAEDFVTRVGKSDTSRTARLNNIKTNIKAVQNSNDVFQNIKSMFNGDAREFSKFFRDRKDLVLVNLDNKFQIKLMDTDNISNVEAILASSQTDKFAIMSRDIYWQVVNKTQPIVLPKWLESMHKYWVLPTKLFSLYFSMPYMIKNVTSAYLQNVTANGHRPIKAIQTLLETAKTYHQWKELFNLITSDNKTIYNLLGDFDDVNMHWIDLISSPKKKEIFIKKLNEELVDKSGKEAIKIQRLLEILNGLTDADLRMIKEMSEFANTNATFGELTDLQRNININRSKTEELDRLRAKDKLNDDERHHLWLHNNRPNGEFGTTWQDELDELNAKQNKVADDFYRMNIIKQYMHDDGYIKHMNNVQKYTGMKAWMDFNSDIEAIFRISMVKDQIEMGADLSQATQKVMDTHFIYNDKSLGMKLLEIIFPFASYPMKAANLFLDLAGDSSFVKTMYLWNKYSWGDEEDAATTSSYLQNRKAQGDIPIGDRLLHLGNAFTESLTALSNPLGAMNDKLTPLLKLPVDALTNAEYSRASQLAGQLYNPVRAIEDMQKTGQFHAGSLFNTSQAYYKYQNNYDKGYYRNYPQRSYLYRNMYTSGGYSRVAMNMQQTTLNNLQYRVGSILYNARYRHR